VPDSHAGVPYHETQGRATPASIGTVAPFLPLTSWRRPRLLGRQGGKAKEEASKEAPQGEPHATLGEGMDGGWVARSTAAPLEAQGWAGTHGVLLGFRGYLGKRGDGAVRLHYYESGMLPVS